MNLPPRSSRDTDFTEIEAVLRTHEHPPIGAHVEVVLGRVLDADFIVGWHDGAMTAPNGLDSAARGS